MVVSISPGNTLGYKQLRTEFISGLNRILLLDIVYIFAIHQISRTVQYAQYEM